MYLPSFEPQRQATLVGGCSIMASLIELKRIRQIGRVRVTVSQGS